MRPDSLCEVKTHGAGLRQSVLCIMPGRFRQSYNGPFNQESHMTQHILIIANGAPYGSESLFNALRLGIALKEEAKVDLNLFLMSDAVTAALAGQAPAEGYNLRQMLEILLAQGARIRLCKSCTDARGITPLPLVEGIEIGTLPLLAQWTLAADKVLTF